VGELRFRGLDLQSGHPSDGSVGGIWLDLDGYFDPPSVRGDDDVIPEAAGQVAGVWIPDHKDMTLVGHVRGSGGTKDERTADWYERTTQLMAVMQMDLAPGLLEVDGPYLGIPTGETHYLNARCIRPIRGQVHNRMAFQFWSFTLRCIDSPPIWQVDASS
jgi:hypothetical protein